MNKRAGKGGTPDDELVELIERYERYLDKTLQSATELRHSVQAAIEAGEPLSPFLRLYFETILETQPDELHRVNARIRDTRDLDAQGLEDYVWSHLPRRYVPDKLPGEEQFIGVYLSGGRDLKTPGDGMERWLREILESVDGRLTTYQSGWGSFFARAAGHATADAMEKAADALKAAVANLPQAEANNMNADAVSKLLAAISDAEEAALAFGPVLVLKVEVDGRARVVTTDLSKAQQRELKRRPNWLLEPRTILDRLAEVADDQPEAVQAGRHEELPSEA